MMADPTMEADDEQEAAPSKTKSRRDLPAGAVATLKAWLLSPEHFTHPYPTPQDQVMLMEKTGIDKKQLKNWFTNARRRIWKPMLKKQLEQGKLAATGAGGGGVAVPGVVPGLMAVPTAAATMPATAAPSTSDSATQHSVRAMHAHYQHAVQQAGVTGTTTQQQFSTNAPAPAFPTQQVLGQLSTGGTATAMAPSSSIGSLPPIDASQVISTTSHMSKTDSHAVLMELFARDQDLVRQATESAKFKNATKGGEQYTTQPQPQQQQPLKQSTSRLGNVPTLNSWPHFSSISSLNNLGTLTGVKSITSLSGADLASQGNLNKMGNLAQVKSSENIGRNDSYAFLEIFFGDRASSTNLLQKDSRAATAVAGIKREREEDNDVGLSLDADESPSTAISKPPQGDVVRSDNVTAFGGTPSMLGHTTTTPEEQPSSATKDNNGTTLKRAYDDALAARGLISVSRSSERLSDLAQLPAKIQRTLSQEYLRQRTNLNPPQQPQQQHQQQQQYNVASYAAPSPSQQYPGQNPRQPQTKMESSNSATPQQQQQPNDYNSGTPPTTNTTPTTTHASVEVPSETRCALCHQTNVDTQLRPCGHMFHERCLKPSLATSLGQQPKCPIDHIPIQSALLAVPVDDTCSVIPTAKVSH